MSLKIENDQGVEMEVFTQDEIATQIAAKEAELKADFEKQMADKDNHLKTKLDEFQQGKTAQELKDTERDTAIAEARKIAEEAKTNAQNAEQRRLDSLKGIAMRKFVGDDAELVTKFEESWAIVNLEIKDDSDIAKKAELVANMIGVNQSNQTLGSMPMGGGGGFAPKVSAVEKAKGDAEYSKFKSVLGLDEFIPKTE